MERQTGQDQRQGPGEMGDAHLFNTKKNIERLPMDRPLQKWSDKVETKNEETKYELFGRDYEAINCNPIKYNINCVSQETKQTNSLL